MYIKCAKIVTADIGIKWSRCTTNSQRRSSRFDLVNANHISNIYFFNTVRFSQNRQHGIKLTACQDMTGWYGRWIC